MKYLIWTVCFCVMGSLSTAQGLRTRFDRTPRIEQRSFQRNFPNTGRFRATERNRRSTGFNTDRINKITERANHFKNRFNQNGRNISRQHPLQNRSFNTNRFNRLSIQDVRQVGALLNMKSNRAQAIIGNCRNTFHQSRDIVNRYKGYEFKIAVNFPEVRYNLLLMQRSRAYINYLQRLADSFQNGLSETNYLEQVLTMNDEVVKDFSDEELDKIVEQIDQVLGTDVEDYPVKIRDSDLDKLSDLYTEATN